MINKHIYLSVLSALFVCNVTNTSQQPGLSDEIGKQVVKQSCMVLGTQLNEGINYLKEKNGIITPGQKAQQEYTESQIELNNKQMELNEQQKALNTKQDAIADLQIQQHQNEIFMQQITEFQSLRNLDPHDPEYEKTLKRLKLKAKQLLQDLPELPIEEPKTTTVPVEQDIKNEPTKDGLLKSLSTYCVLAATTAGTAADTVAGYSLEYITGLDCLKDTFIDKHHIMINRAIIGTALAALTYKTYSVYKKYAAEALVNDDDIFNDDLD